MSNFWEQLGSTALGIFFPPSSNMQSQGYIESGVDQQTAAAEEAMKLMEENYNYQQSINEPYMGMGQDAATRLSMGDFTGDTSIFNGYSPYTASPYVPQEMYQSTEQQPEFKTNSATNQVVITDQAPQLAAQRDIYEPGKTPDAYSYDQYQNTEQTPGTFSYDQSTPQFSAYQQQEQQPQQYIAPEAQAANYWQPEEFNLGEDQIYQRALSEANKATESSAAAQGMQLSGATLKALQENAVGLSNEYGQEAYDRYVTQQGMNQQAQNYQNEDVYNRYLNQVGIKSAEGQQALNQYNTNRQYGQTSNLENYNAALTGQQQGYSQALGTQQQNYEQYAGNRAQNLADYQTNLGAGQYADQAATSRYDANRNYQLAAATQGSADDLARYAAQTGQYNQNIQNQLAVQGQNWNQANTAYQQNLDQYNTNRAFDYGVYGDYGNQLFEAQQYNTQNSQLNSALNYQMLTDAYNRDVANKQTQYGQLGDITNLGVGAVSNLTNAANEYSGNTADLMIGQSNAYAAAMAAQADNTGLLSSLGL